MICGHVVPGEREPLRPPLHTPSCAVIHNGGAGHRVQDALQLCKGLRLMKYGIHQIRPVGCALDKHGVPQTKRTHDVALHSGCSGSRQRHQRNAGQMVSTESAHLPVCWAEREAPLADTVGLIGYHETYVKAFHEPQKGSRCQSFRCHEQKK